MVSCLGLGVWLPSPFLSFIYLWGAYYLPGTVLQAVDVSAGQPRREQLNSICVVGRAQRTYRRKRRQLGGGGNWWLRTLYHCNSAQLSQGLLHRSCFRDGKPPHWFQTKKCLQAESPPLPSGSLHWQTTSHHLGHPFQKATLGPTPKHHISWPGPCEGASANVFLPPGLPGYHQSVTSSQTLWVNRASTLELPNHHGGA